MSADAGAAPRRRGQEATFEQAIISRAWRFFSSMRLALVLILVIAAVILAGTLIEQAPAGVLSDSAAYDQWLDQVRGKYGGWTDVFARLRLFNVFHGLPFRLLLALLSANIVVCTMHRWRAIWTTAFHTRVRMGEPFFAHAKYSTRMQVALPATEAAERLRRTLSRSRYRMSLEANADSVAVLGNRNRFSSFGTFFTHLSLVLILVGGIIGGIFGFKDSEFVVSEGSTRALGFGTDISVRLDHFADEYYVDGPPRDFYSDVVIFDNGKQVKEGTVRVNSPLRYKGIAFHQAFYGQTAVMKVQDKSGKVIFNDGVPLAWQTREGQRPVGSFDLPGENLTVYVVGPQSGANDPLIRPGEMRLELYRQDLRTGTPENLVQGTPKDLAGLTFTFEREKRFAGLKVVKDPGVNIIWIACALMVLGMVALFYFPHRRLWALCKTRDDGTTEVLMAMPANRDVSLGEEFERLRERVARVLEAETPARDPEGGNHV